MSHNETGIVNRLAGCRYRGKGDPAQECDYPTCGCDLWNAPSSASEAHSRGIPVFGAAGAFGGEQFGPPSTNERLVGSYQPKHDADCSARLCGANDATGNVCGERAGHYPHSDDSDYGVHHEFVGQACTCGLASALLREQAQQAEIQPPIDILNELHLRMANHGIASRAFEYEGLVTELISWAAQACRQSQNEKAEAWREKWINDKGIRDTRIAELETALLAAERDRDALTEERDRTEKKDKDSCAELIHQTIPDVEGTEPRLIENGDWVMFVGGWVRRVEVADDGLGRIITKSHINGDREWWQASNVVEIRKPSKREESK